MEFWRTTACQTSLPNLDLRGMWIRPLRAQAEQVLRDVAQRSRLCRRHAADLAHGVLDVIEDDLTQATSWSTATVVAMAAVAAAAAALPMWRPTELGGVQ